VRAIVFEGPHHVAVVDKPQPTIQAPDEALVRITATGICGSDLHIYHGRVGVEPGFTIGHEYVAEVVELGEAVHEIAVGDRVVGGFQSACGVCWLCRRGLLHKCDRSRTFGHGSVLGSLQGTQAELAVVPHADVTLRRVPAALSDEVALFAGDALATGYHAAASVVPGQSVAVLGLGPVGLCAVQCARNAGAAQIIAIDTVPERLALAERFGAVPVHLVDDAPRDVIKRLTGGRGVELAVEAVGSQQALDLALRLVAKCGRVSVIGVHAEPAELHMGLAWIKSLKLELGHANVLVHIDAVLNLLAAGRLDPGPIVTHHLSLDEAAEAYAMYDRREALKIVLTP
jgi:2-desacetyl-2-hydroxyethyl bacteriochlorophyllide A dehydrogenase